MNKKLLIAALFSVAAVVAGLRHPTSPTSRSASEQTDSIASLTRSQRVADYLHQHHQLPAYYLSKQQAKSQGWNAAKGDLCAVLPGKAIGGDRFSNRENLLPNAAGRHWFEADVNYRCGHRGSDRLLYSSDGLIYLTQDHYRHVRQVY